MAYLGYSSPDKIVFMTERFTHLKSSVLKMNLFQLGNIIHRKKEHRVYAYLFMNFSNYLLSVYVPS